MGWILDKVPLWLWIALAAGALFAAWRFLGFKGMLAALGVIVTAGAYRAGRKSGSEDAEAKRLREQLQAKQERLEMRQEHDASQQAAKQMTDDEARKEAMKWARKR